MNAVGRHPEDWTAFEGERSADSEEVFQPLRAFVAAMGEQTVIAHADAQVARNPVQHERDGQRLPAEHEESGYCADMKSNHDAGGERV